MSSQSVRFEWTAPRELDRAAQNAWRDPIAHAALGREAQSLGLDPGTVRVVAVKNATEGTIVVAEAEPLRNV